MQDGTCITIPAWRWSHDRPMSAASKNNTRQPRFEIEEPAGSARHRRPPSGSGFTLMELMVAIALATILVAIAVPSYLQYIQRMKITIAERDIGDLYARIESYTTLSMTPPPDLATIGMANLLDPWGNPYQYLSFTGLKGKGKMRKDKNLVPINTEFDLYSMGPDGQSVPPLTAKQSRDDVIMANDGSYIGPAANF